MEDDGEEVLLHWRRTFERWDFDAVRRLESRRRGRLVAMMACKRWWRFSMD